MKVHAQAVVIVAGMLAALVAVSGPAGAQPPDGEWVAQWEVGGDWLLWTRGNARSRTLLSHQAGGGEALSTSDLGFGFQSGWQIDLAYHYDPTAAVCFRYFGVHNSTGDRVTASGSDRLVFDPPGPVMQTSEGFFVDNSSQLDNWAVSWQQSVNPWLDWQLGLRIAQLRDELVVFSGSRTGDSTTAYYGKNHLFGFDLGAAMRLWDQGGWVRLDGTLKGAVFYNRIDTDAFRWVVPDRGPRNSVTDSEDHGAFLAEAGLIATFRLHRNLTLQCGYQVLWLTGIALAPDQVPVTDFTAGTTVMNDSANLLYHGTVLGLTLVY